MRRVTGAAFTEPPQVFLTLGVGATTSVPVADGSVSLNATPVKSPAAVAFELLMVNVNVAIPFNGMLVTGLNALLMVGGPTTVRVAVLLAEPVPPLGELTAPVGFDTVPACVPVTVTPPV